jgi:CDP-glycerol glycerophosphotransferase
VNIVRKFSNALQRVSRRLNYTGQLSKPLKDAVLFETFSGKQVGDSPLAIALELQKSHPNLTLIWSIAKSELSVPSGMVGLVHGTPAWYRALATSKYLVNNANFPAYFRKRSGQTYLQTWHGTPLKMIGNDIKTDRTSSVYQQTMKREAGYWDYLISPSPFCTEIFPKAFGSKAKVLELGYPRNDSLVNINEATRNNIRARLGVDDPSLKLVLYAPTWRDTSRGANGGWESVNYLNENSGLPSGFKLLYRGHSNTHASHQKRTSESTIDVTFYPNIAELFIAADVLITDYSSVMFDFSVTGKPMIFLTPDIENYEADRGFYFDFRHTAPGPICLNASEAIDDLTRLGNDYAKKYSEWQKKFNHQDDGFAASRVVKAIWG